jgi:hypothetical protein
MLGFENMPALVGLVLVGIGFLKFLSLSIGKGFGPKSAKMDFYKQENFENRKSFEKKAFGTEWEAPYLFNYFTIAYPFLFGLLLIVGALKTSSLLIPIRTIPFSALLGIVGLVSSHPYFFDQELEAEAISGGISNRFRYKMFSALYFMTFILLLLLPLIWTIYIGIITHLSLLIVSTWWFIKCSLHKVSRIFVYIGFLLLTVSNFLVLAYLIATGIEGTLQLDGLSTNQIEEITLNWIGIATPAMIASLLFIFFVDIGASHSNAITDARLLDDVSTKWVLEVENARQAQELEQARQLQLSMLPQDKPPTPQLDISWYMETATEVGGDYYDYTLDSEGNLTIVLGDATGHGMQAGTVVTASKSLFQAMGNEPQITETFSAMSKSLKNMNLPRLGMAMTMVKVQGNKLRLSSAGMPPMLLYRAATGKAEEVLLEGMPLGYSTLAEYEERGFELTAGDTVLLMSDGLPERMNAEDEWLDYPKILEAFESVGDRTPDEIIQNLVSVGEAWADGRENDDDESFVCLQYRGIP